MEKYIKYFLVYPFCSELAATGKSGMVNVINVSHCSKTLNFRNPFLLRMQLLKLQKKCSNSAILMPRKFGPVYVQVRKMHITETILNFKNVQVVLGKEYVTIRTGQPKSKQHMHVNYMHMGLYYIRLLFIFRLTLRFIESNQVCLNWDIIKPLIVIIRHLK